MPTLQLSNNSTVNPITVDLSQYLILTDDEPPDPYDPAFTQRIFSRSLLKEGATLALTQLVEKEQTWNLLLGPYNTASAMAIAIQQINEVLNTPGAVLSWQDDGLSQPTYFDLLVGELSIEYSYRKAQKAYTKAKLLTFSSPLGRTGGPRAYAAASGVGPLLYLAPSSYLQKTASPGQIVYQGNPSLAGDAPALLVLGYVGASSIPGISAASQSLAYSIVSLLPDSTYQPLLRAPIGISGWTSRSAASVPGANLLTLAQTVPSSTNYFGFIPAPSQGAYAPPATWAGQHRLLALARASGTWGTIFTLPGTNIPVPTTASVGPPAAAFSLYDLGTVGLKASEYNPQTPLVGGAIPSVAGVGANAALDIGALIMLPDNATWFAGPSAHFPLGQNGLGNFTEIDDTLGDQFIDQFNQTAAPSPNSWSPVRVTQYSRGLVPRPDPKNGVPIMVLLGVGASGVQWPFPLMSALVSVQERTRYVLP